MLREELDYTRTVSSLHSVALSAGIITVGFVGARVTKAIGRARAIEIGSVGVALGVLLLIGAGLLLMDLAFSAVLWLREKLLLAQIIQALEAKTPEAVAQLEASSASTG